MSPDLLVDPGRDVAIDRFGAAVDQHCRHGQAWATSTVCSDGVAAIVQLEQAEGQNATIRLLAVLLSALRQGGE